MRLTLSLLSLVLAGCAAGPGSARPTPAAPLAITHVTIVDVTGGASRPDMTVLVAGNRITAIAPADSATPPSAATVVDGRGKFLIPGLWDMHVHAAWPGTDGPAGQLFVANGVTGVRDMWGDPGVIRGWRTRVAAGDERTPRIVAAGNLVDGPDPVWPNSIRVDGADDARRTVRRLRQDGAEFIKVYSRLPREAYFAIAEESRRIGIPFAGHVTVVVTAAEASDAGQRSIEHLSGVALGCSAREDAVVREAQSLAASNRWVTATTMVRQQSGAIASSYDPARCAALAARFARNQTWQVPTLTVLHNMAYRGDPSLKNDARYRYIPRFVRQRWEARSEALGAGADESSRRALYAREIRITGLLDSAGVPIMAGTDEGNPYCMPGFSLHDELARLVESGLSPLEALQAATLNPANFLGATDSLGTVAAGKLADLVLLDGDPLLDIHNTSRISAVVVNGRLIDAAARQRLLDDAASAQGPPPPRVVPGVRRPVIR